LIEALRRLLCTTRYIPWFSRSTSFSLTTPTTPNAIDCVHFSPIFHFTFQSSHHYSLLVTISHRRQSSPSIRRHAERRMSTVLLGWSRSQSSLMALSRHHYASFSAFSEIAWHATLRRSYHDKGWAWPGLPPRCCRAAAFLPSFPAMPSSSFLSPPPCAPAAAAMPCSVTFSSLLLHAVCYRFSFPLSPHAVDYEICSSVFLLNSRAIFSSCSYERLRSQDAASLV